MINITLPNGSVKEFDAAGVTPLEVAKSLSNSKTADNIVRR